MQPEATPDRRTVVLAGAVLGTAGLGVLSGCSSGSGTASSTVTSNGNAAPSEDDGGSSPAASAGGSSGGLVALSQVPVGGAVLVQAPTGRIVVAQPSAGKVVAFSAICTHQGCLVQPAGNQLDCPCHGSVFDAFTGQVVQGPAQAALPSVPVAVSGQDVVAG